MTTRYGYGRLNNRLVSLKGNAAQRRKQRRALMREGATFRTYDGGAGAVMVNLPSQGTAEGGE